MFLQLFHRDAPYFSKTLLQYLNTDNQILLSKVNTQMIHIVRTLYLFFFTECQSLTLFDHSFFTLSQYEHCLTYIDIGEDLKDLDGIEECTQLTELDLSYCKDINGLDGHYWERMDLTPLVNLTKLDLSDMRTPKLCNIEPLCNLVNLTELDLSENDLCDYFILLEEPMHQQSSFILTPLQCLTNLVKLDLHWQVSDRWEFNTICLQPLSHLTQLTNLNVSGFWKTSAASLFHLTQLKTLHFGQCNDDYDDTTHEKIKSKLPFTNIWS